MCLQFKEKYFVDKTYWKTYFSFFNFPYCFLFLIVHHFTHHIIFIKHQCDCILYLWVILWKDARTLKCILEKHKILHGYSLKGNMILIFVFWRQLYLCSFLHNTWLGNGSYFGWWEQWWQHKLNKATLSSNWKLGWTSELTWTFTTK